MSLSGRRAASVGVLLTLLSGPSLAQDLSAISSEVGSLEAQSRQSTEGFHPGATANPQTTNVEERFADAELLYRLRDYDRSAVLFTDIVENYANTPAYPQGLFLLGDSLFLAGDRFGARTRFREVLRHAGEPVFRPFVQRSLGRLIEIALRTNNFDGVEDYFRQLGQIPPSEIDAQTRYIRGKYLFLRTNPDYDGARAAFEGVPQNAPVYAQARYFLGAILTVQQHYPEAIEAFQRVSQLQGDDGDTQRVIDLAILAVGRLQVEREHFDAAIEAYQRVSRSSDYFDRALFEQAWAYIKLGDSVRAERALEILSVSSPDSPLVPEGRILWGNLLLRTGRFERAQQVFEDVRTQFGPIYQQLHRNNGGANPERYFQELVRSNLQVFDASSFIPAPALAWVRHEGTLDESLQVVSDLNTCRTYIREASDLIDRLNAAINAPSRSHVFRDLGRARQRVWQIANRVAQLRDLIATRAMDVHAEASNVDLQSVISQRRALAAQLGRLPINDDGLRRRDRQAESELQALAQNLQRNQQRVDALEAMAVANERYLNDPAHPSTGLDRTQVLQELTGLRAGIQQYRDRVVSIRRMIEQARAQIGPGDPRYAHDVDLRRQVQDLTGREASALRSAGRLPGEADALLTRLDTLDQGLSELDGRVNSEVDRRIVAIRAQVQAEEGRVSGYRERLGALERESEEVVGNLVLQRFREVELQFYQIIMRADLGLVDVAWERREEHNNRARLLAEEQSREVSALNDEFAEVTEGAAPEDAARINPQQQSGAAGSSGSGTSGAVPDQGGPSAPVGGGAGAQGQ